MRFPSVIIYSIACAFIVIRVQWEAKEEKILIDMDSLWIFWYVVFLYLWRIKRRIFINWTNSHGFIIIVIIWWWCKVEYMMFFPLINGSQKWLNFSWNKVLYDIFPRLYKCERKREKEKEMKEIKIFLILWHTINVYYVPLEGELENFLYLSLYIVIYYCVKSAHRRNNWKSFILWA